MKAERTFKDPFELIHYLLDGLEEYLDPSDPVDRLILREDAFSWDQEVSRDFLEAMRRAYQLQLTNFPQYSRGVELLRRRGLAKYPDEIGDLRDLKYIPPISVWTLKTMDFKPSGDIQPLLVLHSSGTSGRRSYISLSERSLRRIAKIVKNIYTSYRITSGEPANYLMFSYEITKGMDIGTAFSDALLMRILSPQRKVFWAFKWDKELDDFKFDLEGTLRAIDEFYRDRLENGTPLRILGFPAYIWFTLQEIRKMGKTYKFGDSSWVLPGGGWKTLEDKEIPKEVFRKEIRLLLGIPEANIRDLYGMVEHGIPYVECERWEFHLPIYSRVLVLDPGYGYQPEGNLGLLQFLTPYIDSYPSISIISSDAGTVTKPECDRSSDRLVLIGRAGKIKLRGCAIDALRLLRTKNISSRG